MKPFRTFSALLGALVLASCSFEKNAVQDITGPIASARIKFFHFGVNAPGVNFYAGNAKVTAITSATGVESTTGVVYGGVGSGGFYSAVDPGQYVLTGKIAATVDKDLAISPVTATITDGKAYSYYMSGFYSTATKTVEGFVVEDAFPAAIDFTQAYVRFVNAISNSNPMTLFGRRACGLSGGWRIHGAAGRGL
jgi:microcystin-dependent protein